MRPFLISIQLSIMYHVYIIESETTGRMYIGQTQDPEKRLSDHNRGASNYTRNKGPWKIIFLKEFLSRRESIAYEKKLKAWKNPDRIKAMISRGADG